MNISGVLKSMGIDAVELKYLIRCVVRVHFAAQREVPSASEVLGQVQILHGILRGETKVHGRCGFNTVDLSPLEFGQLMVGSLGVMNVVDEVVLNALGESLLANDLQRSNPDSTLNQRLYSLCGQDDLEELVRSEDRVVRGIYEALQGDCLNARAVAALLLSLEDMCPVFVRKIQPSSARLVKAFSLATELNALTYFNITHFTREGWKNAFCGALASLSGKLDLPSLISMRDLRVLEAVCLEIYNSVQQDCVQDLFSNLDTFAENQDTSSFGALRSTELSMATAFNIASSVMERALKLTVPISARTGNIGWKYLGNLSLKHYSALKAIYDAPQDT